MTERFFAGRIPMLLGLGGAMLIGCSTPALFTAKAAVEPCASAQTLLSAGVAMTPVALSGWYGSGCKRHGGEIWNLRLDGGPSDLEVTSADTLASCPLTLAAVQMKTASSPEGKAVEYSLSPPLRLGPAYAASAAAASPAGAAGDLAFYVNAQLIRLAQPAYASDFAVSLVYAAEPSGCEGITPPPVFYNKHAAGGGGSVVSAPNYEIDASGVVSVVDANHVVQASSSGRVELWLPSAGPRPAEEYKVLPADVGSDPFAKIDAAYRAAEGAVPIAGSESISIPFVRFGLVGSTLPQTRSIVARHKDSESGVLSYEALRISFPAPRD